MTPRQYESSLSDAGELDLHARSAEAVTWHGGRALRLDGLALVPHLRVADARIDVPVGADGRAIMSCLSTIPIAPFAQCEHLCYTEAHLAARD